MVFIKNRHLFKLNIVYHLIHVIMSVIQVYKFKLRIDMFDIVL